MNSIVLETNTLKHQHLQHSGRSPVSVFKRAHCREVIMEGQRLNEWIVFPECGGRLTGQTFQSLRARVASLDSTMSRHPKGNVLPPLSGYPGTAVIVITTEDDRAMDFPNQIYGDWTAFGYVCDFSISSHSCVRLPL